MLCSLLAINMPNYNFFLMTSKPLYFQNEDQKLHPDALKLGPNFSQLELLLSWPEKV